MGRTQGNELTETQIEVIKAMADNKLHAATAGRALFLASSGIAYHCARIKNKTGLDPCDFWDMQKLVKLIGYEKEKQMGA